MFTVEVDEPAGVLHLTLWGFWTTEVLERFVAAVLPAVARLHARPGGYHVLSDSTAFPVQSAAVSQGFDRFMAAGAARARGRTAIVVASVLNKLQAGRVLSSSNIGIFLDRDEALAWLAEAPVAA